MEQLNGAIIESTSFEIIEWYTSKTVEWSKFQTVEEGTLAELSVKTTIVEWHIGIMVESSNRRIVEW